MYSISATVCDEKDSGTQGSVRLLFKTSSNAPSKGNNDNVDHECQTDDLNKESDDWVRGKTHEWTTNYLGGCANPNWGRQAFVLQNNLEVKFSLGKVGTSYELKICKILVSFGFPYSLNGTKTQWQWIGEKWINNRGAFNENWLEMQMVQTS